MPLTQREEPIAVPTTRSKAGRVGVRTCASTARSQTRSFVVPSCMPMPCRAAIRSVAPRTRRIALAFVAAVSSSALIVACSLKGLSGGSEEDAGNGQDAPISETSDVIASEDAGWCARQVPKPDFCDDFDRETPIAFGWVAGAGASNVFPETRVAASPPRSLLSALLPDSGTCKYGQLRQEMAGAFHQLHLEFQVRPGALDEGGVTSGGIASWNTAAADDTGSCTHILLVDAASATLHAQWPGEAGFDDRFKGLTRYPLSGQWTMVAVDIADDGSGNVKESIAIDGQVALDAEALPTCKLGGGFKFSMGLFCNAGPKEVRIDNVAFVGR